MTPKRYITGEREQIERRLLDEICRQGRAYWLAVDQAKLAAGRNHDLALGHSDGNLARRQAGRLEAEALERYRQAVKAFNDFAAQNRQAQRVPEEITPREREVLTLIARGKTSKELAGELGISFKTAISHRSSIQSKLEAHNTADLTRAAIRMGLVEP